MRDMRIIIGLIVLAILGLIIITLIFVPASAADNLTENVTPNQTATPTPTPTHTPIPVRIVVQTQSPFSGPIPVKITNTSPTNTSIPYFVQQGDTVYLGDTVDISGVTAGILNLAYYGGWDEESGRQFLVELPQRKSGYYRFYIDPAIFGTRLGKWYKWNGYVERQANNLAFVVAYQRAKTNLSENITLQNPNQTPLVLPKVPILPAQHVADYLIARGDSIAIPATNHTKAWIFGSVDSLYDYYAVNGTIDLKENIIDKLSPGSYTLMLHTRDASSNGEFTVRYNPDTSMIDWFDSATFSVNHYDTAGQTPENVMNKLKSILPAAHDTFKLYSMEVQNPTITINQIDTAIVLNDSMSAKRGTSLEAPSYIDVRGYTNAAPDTIVKVVVDPDFNMDIDQMFKDGIATGAQETNPGDMRVFKVIVPVKMYSMGPGKHFIAAKTALSDAYVTADFYIYENPAGNFIPNKSIRYISGKYGPQELIPTPTPITVTQIVTKVVTQVVTVPVTPSNEQVYAQQKIASEKTWWEGVMLLAKGIGLSAFLIGGMWYSVSVVRRLKE